MKKLLTITLALSLLCATLLFVPASATEAEEDPYLMDWDSVDWETFKWSDYFDNMDYDFFYLLDHWTDWMINEASVEQLVAVAKAHPDAAYSESYHYALRVRFLGNPGKMIQEQARSSRSVQAETVEGIVSGREDQDPAALIALLSSFALPADATNAEHDILEEIISLTEQRFDVVIPRNEAPEIIDWNTVDWDTFNLLEYCRNDDGGDDWARVDSWYTWMKNEATLDQLMEVVKAKMGAYQSPLYADALVCRFIKEPLAMLTAMTQCDSDMQDDIAGYLAFSEAYGAEEVDIVKFLTDLQLPEGASAERAMLNKIIDYVEQYHGVEIPRTGDPIALALAALLLSGMGLAVTIHGKKKIV